MPKRKFIADGTGKAPRKINKSAASFPRWRPSSLQRRHAGTDAALTIASNYKLLLPGKGKNVQKASWSQIGAAQIKWTTNVSMHISRGHLTTLIFPQHKCTSSSISSTFFMKVIPWRVPSPQAAPSHHDQISTTTTAPTSPPPSPRRTGSPRHYCVMLVNNIQYVSWIPNVYLFTDKKILYRIFQLGAVYYFRFSYSVVILFFQWFY